MDKFFALGASLIIYSVVYSVLKCSSNHRFFNLALGHITVSSAIPSNRTISVLRPYDVLYIYLRYIE
jgi:hypothetical protein